MEGNNKPFDFEHSDIEQILDFAHKKFVQIYEQKFKQPGEPFYQEQRNLFLTEYRAGSYHTMLENSRKENLFFAFMSLAINGLSLEKGTTPTCYLECRSICVGKDPKINQKIYERMAVITISGYGEIVLRQRAGQIKSVDTPKIVYDCDSFREGERNGQHYIEYERCLPRPAGAKKIACYLRIIKADGSIDYFVMDLDEIARLKNYSSQSNFGKPNALYGRNPDCSDIDSGFLMAKTIKHAFKGYPKLSIGAGAAMEADKDTDQPAEEAPQQPKQPETFGDNQPKQGVTVETSEDSPF